MYRIHQEKDCIFHPTTTEKVSRNSEFWTRKNKKNEQEEKTCSIAEATSLRREVAIEETEIKVLSKGFGSILGERFILPPLILSAGNYSERERKKKQAWANGQSKKNRNLKKEISKKKTKKKIFDAKKAF